MWWAKYDSHVERQRGMDMLNRDRTRPRVPDNRRTRVGIKPGTLTFYRGNMSTLYVTCITCKDKQTNHHSDECFPCRKKNDRVQMGRNWARTGRTIKQERASHGGRTPGATEVMNRVI